MGQEVGLLLIVVILAIGGVWQEREPGTKVALSRARACVCPCVCNAAAPSIVPACFQCNELAGLGVWGTGAEEHLWSVPSTRAHLPARPQETLAHWFTRVQAAAASVPVQLCSSGPCLQGPLGCPCLCDSFAAGGTMHHSPAPTAAACTRFCKALL